MTAALPLAPAPLAPPPARLPARGRALGLLAALALGSPAFAADPVLLVPAPPLVADGSGAVRLEVWSPAIGADSEFSLSGAELVEATVLEDDLAALVVKLPPAAQPGELSLGLKVKGTAGKAEGALRVRVGPPERAALVLRADPPSFRMGVDDAATVRVELPPGLRASASRKIKLLSNLGQVESVAVDGNTAVARWRPGADIKASQVVLFTAIDEAAPEAVLGGMAYPVLVKRDLPFPAAAGSTVVLTVGERQFGPVTAGPDGKAILPVERDPKVTKGRLRVVAPGGAVSESEVELAFGEGPRFSLAPLPAGIGADERDPFELHIYVTGSDGQPWTGAPPTLSVDKGSVGPAEPGGGPGMMMARWATGGASGPATVTATLDGRSQSLKTTLVAEPGIGVQALILSPTLLGDAVKEVNFTVRSEGSPAIATFGGQLRPARGKAPATIGLDEGSAAVVVLAGPSLPASGQPVARLVVWTPADVAAADGVGRVPVGVVALDDDGLPVPNVALSWSVEGGGSLSGAATTGANGLAAGLYLAGSQVGPVGLRVEAAGVVGLSPLFLQGAGYAPKAGASGAEAALAERAQWRGATSLEVAGRATGAPLPAVAPMTAADLARMEAEKKAAEKAAKKAAAAPAGGGGGGGPKPAAGGGGGDPLSFLGAAPDDGYGQGALRVSAALLGQPRVYKQTADEAPLPGDLAWETPGALSAPGIDLRATFQKDRWGGDLIVKYATQKVATPFSEEALGVATTELVAAPTMRGVILPGLVWTGSLGVHRFTVPAFAYDDAEKPTEVLDEASSALGLRIAGGLTLDRGPLYLRVQAAPTMAAGAQSFGLDSLLGVSVSGPWSAQLGWAKDWRTSRPEISGAEAKVEEQVTGLHLGAAYRR